MYSQNDLDEAVAAGALSAESATSLRNFIEAQRSLPAVDEEQFRLITGFNDIFVSIAAVILLVAVETKMSLNPVMSRNCSSSTAGNAR